MIDQGSHNLPTLHAAHTIDSYEASALPSRTWNILCNLFSRDDPTFIACVLIAALSAHYFPRGIDYFPSPEICMIYGYTLLATAIATFLLRLRSRFALSALIVAAFLSVRTVSSVCLSLGISRDFAIWLWDLGPTGYLLLFKGFLSITRIVGMSYSTADLLFNIMITGSIFCVCTQAFFRTTIRIAAGTFLIAYFASFVLFYFAVQVIGPDIQYAQPTALFMMLQTGLYWRFIPHMSKRFPSVTAVPTA